MSRKAMTVLPSLAAQGYRASPQVPPPEHTAGSSARPQDGQDGKAQLIDHGSLGETSEEHEPEAPES